jgi:hypothetical protein
MRDTRRRPRLPALIRFLAGHCALGVTAGLATAALLLWLDIGGIGSLVAGDGGSRWIAIGLLGFGFAITFGSLAMGSALFLLSSDDDPDDGPPLHVDQAPVRSAARTRARWKV